MQNTEIPPSLASLDSLDSLDNKASLTQWLEHCERLHPKEISLGLERTRQVAQRMRLEMRCPVITVAGTNGKGSTCAMLESIALQAGYVPGVYTSPHFVNFEERCRVHGEVVAPEELVEHFAAVEEARGQTQLTYFEFTTLAILRFLSQAKIDVAIVEVGLGGRLDATNIIDPSCAIITSIDVDHTQFLGSTREQIGYEKAGIMRAGKPVIVSDPMPPQSILDYAQEIGADLWRFGHDFNYNGDPQQWAWAGRGRRYAGLAYPALRGANQLLNAAGALAAFEALRHELPVTAQAVRTGLALVELQGRFEVIPGEPTVILDVAHNPHSVAALAANLSSMHAGSFARTLAVFGAMRDKDLRLMLETISPLVDEWFFTDLPIERGASASEIAQIWSEVEPNANTAEALTTAAALSEDMQQTSTSSVHLTVRRIKGAAQVLPAAAREAASQTPKFSHICADPQQALDAALATAGTTDRIVVFGSFYTVGAILKEGKPSLHAKHLRTEWTS